MICRRLGFSLLALVFTGVAAVAACGTDAVGVQTCRQIEEARCRQAPKCPTINLGSPAHPGGTSEDVDACIRFYQDACLHGLATNSDPGAPQTKACIDAINKGDCKVIGNPETDPACAWLVPPQPPPAADAGTDADAGVADADTDAAADTGAPDVFGALGI